MGIIRTGIFGFGLGFGVALTLDFMPKYFDLFAAPEAASFCRLFLAEAEEAAALVEVFTEDFIPL